MTYKNGSLRIFLKNYLLLCTVIVVIVLNLWWIFTSQFTKNCYTNAPELYVKTIDTDDKIEDITKNLKSHEWSPYFNIPKLNETGFPIDIVPNIVHYVLFQEHIITFIHYISIKSVVMNHHPEKIIIHCDCTDLHGNYWNRVKSELSKMSINITVQYFEKPTSIYGKHLSSEWINWHASDIARAKILMKYGGIYLDRDVYVVQSLNKFRKYELTIAWDEGMFLGTQIILANRNARFLNAWIDSYRNYDSKGWYYNAGELPTKSILWPYPHIVHRVRVNFGVDGEQMCPYLYLQNHNNWTQYYTIHLLIRGGTVDDWCIAGRKKPAETILNFDEENVKHAKSTFGQMARVILYGTKDFVN